VQEFGAARSHTGQEHAERGRQGGKKIPQTDAPPVEEGGSRIEEEQREKKGKYDFPRAYAQI
jgi:hypothetical protein